MPDNIKDLETLAFALMFIIPGFIMLAVRTQFIDGSWKAEKNTALMQALVMSIFYLGFSFPIIHWLDPLSSESLIYQEIIILGAFIVTPAILGVLLGKAAQRNWFGKGLNYLFGVSRLHPFSTAWDWKMGKREKNWVIVTLKNGTIVKGYCGADSCMSSNPSERDFYIDAVCHINEEQVYNELVEGKPRGCSALYIAKDQISTIEFIFPEQQRTQPKLRSNANVTREKNVAAE